MGIIRFYIIIKVLLQHGLDELIPKRMVPWYLKLVRISLFWIVNKHKKESEGRRIMLAMQALGPVFIKFGQMLSTRKDLLPIAIAGELEKLQDSVTPFSSAQAEKIILQSLNISSIDQRFSEFETKPLASASIAQVHAAKLKENQQDVVVKVLRPDVKKVIIADVKLMYLLARALLKWLPDGNRLRPVEVVSEYEKTILDELDLSREAANGTQLKHNFDGSDSLYVPYIYQNMCSRDVLVMERIYGIPVSDVDKLHAQNTNMQLLAQRGVEVFFTQVFRDSFFHADMHPGNIFVSEKSPQNPQYIAIDFGIVGTLNQQDKHYLASNFIAFFNQDYRKVAQLHIDSEWVPFDTDVDEFEREIRKVCAPIFQKPLDEISFGQVLMQLFNTAHRFNMEVQPQLVLLQKTLLYVEGVGRQLYPQLDLWATAKPFLENWMQEQMGVKAVFNKVKNNLPYWSEKFPEIPDLLYDNLHQLKHFPARQFRANQALLEAHKLGQQSLLFGVIGAAFIISAVIVFVETSSLLFTTGMVSPGLIFWLKALKLNRKIKAC